MTLNARSLISRLSAFPDALHLRQIAKRLQQLAARDSAGQNLSYAGAL